MAVSGELRYFGPAFSSVERVRPVNAMMRPESLAIGTITRLRNLEYTAREAFSPRLSAFSLLGGAPSSGLPSRWSLFRAGRGIGCSGELAADGWELSFCELSFHENSPL